jgi:hypoxanthine-guanine phosphoribosyltransferase
MPSSMHADVVEILFTEEQIQASVSELGKLLAIEYAGKAPLVLGVSTTLSTNLNTASILHTLLDLGTTTPPLRTSKICALTIGFRSQTLTGAFMFTSGERRTRPHAMDYHRKPCHALNPVARLVSGVPSCQNNALLEHDAGAPEGLIVGSTLDRPFLCVYVCVSDLVRSMQPVPEGLTVDFIRASSYGGSATVTSGEVLVAADLKQPLEGRHVLLVRGSVCPSGHPYGHLASSAHLVVCLAICVYLCVNPSV